MESLPIILGTISFIILILLLWVIRLEIRLKNILGGHKSKDLETSLNSVHKDLEKMNAFSEKAVKKIDSMDERIKKSVQGIETIRFNPFKGTGSGGNHSFATAMLNEKGDGVVISSIYSRERVSIYAKPIESHSSKYDLSEEEKMALGKAAEKIK